MATNPIREEFKAFAAKIARARGAAEKSQAVLARLVGKSREWINLVETARILPSDRQQTGRLADALGLDLESLWLEVVELRTPEDERAVWERKIRLASLAPGQIEEDERALLLILRELGEAAGLRGGFVASLLGLLRGMRRADSPVMLSLGPSPTAPHAPPTAPHRVADALVALGLVARLRPGAQAGFLRSLVLVAQAYGVADIHTGGRAFKDALGTGSALLTPSTDDAGEGDG